MIDIPVNTLNTTTSTLTSAAAIEGRKSKTKKRKYVKMASYARLYVRFSGIVLLTIGLLALYPNVRIN